MPKSLDGQVLVSHFERDAGSMEMDTHVVTSMNLESTRALNGRSACNSLAVVSVIHK